MSDDLLERAADELERTVAQLQATRAEHGRVEAILSAVLEHLPLAVVVLDDDGVVRAASAAAEDRWGVALDRTPRLPDAVTAVDFDGTDGRRLQLVWDATMFGGEDRR